MIANINTNNGKRLVAAVAIIAMLACCLAIAVPAANAADDNTYNGTYAAEPPVRGEDSAIMTEVAQVTFLNQEGNEYLGYGNVTNSDLGNKNLKVVKVDNNTVNVTGTLANNDGNSAFGYDNYDYGFVINLSDLTEGNDGWGFGDKTASPAETVYIYYTNAAGIWTHLAKSGSTTSQLIYVNENRDSTTYYFSETPLNGVNDESSVSNNTPKLTITWDFALASTSTGEDLETTLGSGATEVQVNSGTISGNITVGSEQTVTIGSNVNINSDANFSVDTGGTITFDTNNSTFIVVGNSNTTVKFSNVSGNFTVVGGSVEINGNISGTMTVSGTEADVVLSGTVSNDTTIIKSGDDSTTVTFDNLTVNPGVTLYLDDGIDYSVEYTGDDEEITSTVMNLYGSISAYYASDDPKNPAKQIDITVDGENSFNAYAGSKIGNGIQIVGTGDIDASLALSTITVNDDISMNFNGSQSQRVVIASTLTIEAGWSMNILGELVVNEGVTLIIEDGASLNIGRAAAEGVSAIKATGMTVNGEIEVMEGGSINVYSAEAVDVSGTITSSGTVDITSGVTIENGGSIVIDDYDGSNIKVDGGLTVNAGGELIVSADMNITGIKNKGTVTLDGANITFASEIKMAADGAVVDIRSFTSNVSGENSLKITDEGLKYTDKTDGPFNNMDNRICFTGSASMGVRGLTVTEHVTSKVVDGESQYSTYMTLSGSVSVADGRETPDAETAEYSINIAFPSIDGKFLVESEDSLTLGRGIEMTLWAGKFDVQGTVTATAANSSFSASTGVIDVSGTVTVINEIKDNINAFQYVQEMEPNDYYVYATLNNALASNAETIRYMGTVYVLENATIPTGTTLRNYSDTASDWIYIGDEDHRDVVVTVEDGATVTGCDIDVYATLTFNNDRKDNRSTNDIRSDVTIDNEPAKTFTNIYTALDNAASGETVTISRTTGQGNVILNSDIEVKEGVTLIIPTGSTVQMYNDVTLTVNGTVRNSGDIINIDYISDEETVTAAGFNPIDPSTNKANNDAATIIVNGTMMSLEQIPYTDNGDVQGYYIVGAYYQLIDTNGSWYYVTPVEQAAAVSNDVVGGAIAINGENTVGDITFTGDSTTNVTVTINGELEAGTITLALATLDVKTAGSSFSGSVANTVGSIEASNVTGFTVQDTTDAEDVIYLYIAGTPVYADENLDSSMTVATGKVNAFGIVIISMDDPEVENDSYIDSFTVATGATFEIATGAEIEADKMTVDGTLTSTDGGMIDVTDLTIRGTLNIMDATDDLDAGDADINNLYVGIAKDDEGRFGDASAASVNAVDLGNSLVAVYVSAESTFAGDIVTGMKYTQFYVEDALWMTVYGTPEDAIAENNSDDTVGYNYKPADLSECEFVAWTTADGKNVPVNTTVGKSGYEQIYANLNYNVYQVVMMIDNSIGSVAIDGQMLSYDYQKGGYVLPSDARLAAGQHTVSYTLNAGYEGTPVLSSSTASVSEMTFTLSGDFEDANGTPVVTYVTLGGATYAGSTVVVEGGNNGGSDSLGLTDYLLIILVILIVIMAIMVAFRLMRS